MARECKRRGWRLVQVIEDDGASGRDTNRPGLTRALGIISDGHASGLVVAELDRLSRSVIDFGQILEWLDHQGATFTALDLGIDTSTAAGRLVGNVMAAVGEWERSAISARTRASLQAKRARGEQIGRASVVDRPELAQRIAAMRADGLTLQAIADALNAEGVPTLRGAAAWRVSAVQSAAGYRRPAKRRAAVEPPPVRRQRQQRSGLARSTPERPVCPRQSAAQGEWRVRSGNRPP